MRPLPLGDKLKRRSRAN